ncbi:hypothetical protein HXA35_05135 [Bacillus sp. A301a_S52]|nr:hypothetical protein [Bacillus sp. A301a_S52]
MSNKDEMNSVLCLQKMKNAVSNSYTSNLSFICKEKSTISAFLCVPIEN